MKNNINEELKRREAASAASSNDNGEMALDSTQRVKVLSPGRLVFKRFIRNKLAVIGTAILITMFVFAFLGPLVYPYGQTEKFYKYDDLNIKYGMASERTEFVATTVDKELKVSNSVKNMINSHINDMKAAGETVRIIKDGDAEYQLTQTSDNSYTLELTDRRLVASYVTVLSYGTFDTVSTTITGAPEEVPTAVLSAITDAVAARETEVTVGGATYLLKNLNKLTKSVEKVVSAENGVFEYPEDAALGDAFEQAVRANLENTSFTVDGVTYEVSAGDNGTTNILVNNGRQTAIVFSNFVFDLYDVTATLSDEFKAQALLLLNANKAEGTFTADDATYTLRYEGEQPVIFDANGTEVAELSTFVVRRYSGEDSLELAFKELAAETITAMQAKNERTGSFTFKLPQMGDDGEYKTNEDGTLTYEDTTITVELSNDQYVLTCEQKVHLIARYSEPSGTHLLGTDGDGYDVLARMMYGGRISLLVGFVVVILETILGVILGGIAGYFGGWVDTLIMRLVDIFNCIPSMPILIILGAFFDAAKMTPYVRLMWMMAVLGFLGWSGVARLVRGQILSLREQEFMVATDACGLSVRTRIFRHLVPNVMPQLIVTATAGLGGVIITESTLSFLGLGVKHPLATWGTMINSVTSSSENMIKFTYIWIPVGLLICLTVIAFNFVGDGLRDAFDPKMKR